MTVFAGQPPAKPGQSNICMNDTIVKIPIVVQKWHANFNFLSYNFTFFYFDFGSYYNSTFDHSMISKKF